MPSVIQMPYDHAGAINTLCDQEIDKHSSLGDQKREEEKCVNRSSRRLCKVKNDQRCR